MGTQNNTSPSPSDEADHKVAESRAFLETWQQQNSALLNILLDSYCLVDIRNHVVTFNEAFPELCGLSHRKALQVGYFCELIKTEFCPDRCPAVQAMGTSTLIRLDEVRGSSKVSPELHMIVASIPILNAQGQTMGALVTLRDVSAETELQKKYDERKKESVIDGLTGIFNKVYSETLLLRLLKSAMRDQYKISIAMCDIDHFKKINDTYGHQAGDFVLSNVAKMIKGESRDSDIVGRFGGEEFIVGLSNSDTVGASIFTERVRRRVANHSFIFEGKQIPVTVSLGTGTLDEKWHPGFDSEQALRELINRADTALYYAKANGRNQSCQHENLPNKNAKKTKKAA